MKPAVVFPPCSLAGTPADKGTSPSYPAKGKNAGIDDVVLGSDTRLSDPRRAADVYPWAKAPEKPDYTPAEIGAASDKHTHPVASRNVSGFMSAQDKRSFDNLLRQRFAFIDDSAIQGGTLTYSVSKILQLFTDSKRSIKEELTDGAPVALDTLKELARALGNDPNYAATVVKELGNRVRFDVYQGLSDVEKATAKTNLGIIDGLSDFTVNLVAVYNTAKV